MKCVYIRYRYIDGKGKKFLGKWERLRFSKIEILRYYVKKMIDEGDLWEFWGLGWYGFRSVEGFLWERCDRVRKEML